MRETARWPTERTPPSPARPRRERPERLGDYILLDDLGAGGEGQVFRARHRLGDQVVALKMVTAAVGADRLREEIRAIASLRHVNIVRVYFFGEDQGVWYYTMELMEGGSLEKHLGEYQADPRRAVTVLEQVARGVHHAHSRGVLHLDLKPANILLDADGRPQVSDFGLSKRLTITEVKHDQSMVCKNEVDMDAVREHVALDVSQIRGTAPYMSPEMASRSGVVTTSADVYGLGAILYTMLTGRPPFKGVTAAETLRRVLFDLPVAPRILNRKVDNDLQAVCLECLHKDPARRYGSADALANELNRWLRGEPTVYPKPTIGKHVAYWLRRHPFRAAAACAAAVVLWIASLLGSVGELRAINARETARLAHEVEIQLRMIERAVTIVARAPELHDPLSKLPAGSTAQRTQLDDFLRKTTSDYNSWFGIAGGNPLINVFLLDEHGVLVANTFAGRAVGLEFSKRDYFRRLFDPFNPVPREGAIISRVYPSKEDSLFKVGVSTRIWDRSTCLGVIVATITVGPRLALLDMKEEAEGACVLSPVDGSYPERGPSPPPGGHPPFIVALARAYTGADRVPIVPDLAQYPRLAAFEDDLELAVAVDPIRDGAVVNYHRVGGTPLIAVIRTPYPWPIRWMLDARFRRWALPTLAVAATLPLPFFWMRRRQECATRVLRRT